MDSIVIISDKKKYIKKSFLKYNKPELIENFKHEILNENLEKSYFLLFDMINSGFFKDIWITYFMIYSEYIHLLNPNLLQIIHTNYKRYEIMRKNATKYRLNILDSRNEFNFRKILYMILKKLVKTPKKHIGYFIPQSYNNQNKITSTTPLLNIFDGKDIPNFNILKEVINNQDYKDVETAMKFYHHYIQYAIHKKLIYDQEKYEAKNICFFWLAKILVIGSEQTNIIGYPYNISLYHSIDPNSKDYFSPLVWNILLNGSKQLGKQYFNHLVTLYKIFQSRFLHKTQRENFLIIQASLFFFENVLWEPKNINLLQEDYDCINELYVTNEKMGQKKIKNKKQPKLKPPRVIEDNKDDIEKIIQRRQQEIKDLIPNPPPEFDFETITKKDKEKEKEKKKKRKKNKRGKIIYDSDDPEIQLPDIFYQYHKPTHKDHKISQEVDKERNNNKIPKVKPIIISDAKHYKRNLRSMMKNKVKVSKQEE